LYEHLFCIYRDYLKQVEESGRVDLIADNDIQHCTKSKFCAKRNRSKSKETLLESLPVISVPSSL
jgi:hypothetical protein